MQRYQGYSDGLINLFCFAKRLVWPDYIEVR